MTEEEIDLLAEKLADKLEERQSKAVTAYIDLLWNTPIKSQEDYIKDLKGKGIHTMRDAIKLLDE